MRRSFLALAALATLALACDDDDGTNPDVLSMDFGTPSGDAQTGAPSAQLAPFRVNLMRGSTPAANEIVNWAVASGTGTLSVPTSTTDAQGNAETVLTLGPAAGVVTVTATVTGAAGSPLTFFASAVVAGDFAQVVLTNNQFDPDEVTIDAGGTVAFVWTAAASQHNIVPVAPATIPSSATVRNGPFTYEEIFNTPGNYDYFCSVHGTATTGMRGRVVVQ
ncbi:MAG TPA: plastocyanin/azurin family copper-binding protein [Gemmatimonadales bacterium]|nr:plastocyanin/azurin family copper-binding protein [Gemmatimonadales bacterium]